MTTLRYLLVLFYGLALASGLKAQNANPGAPTVPPDSSQLPNPGGPDIPGDSTGKGPGTGDSSSVACNAVFSWSIYKDSVSFNPNVGGVNPLYIIGGQTVTWNFGDGSAPGTYVYPTHVYPGPGSYTVVHTVKDSAAHCMDSVSEVVIISAASDSGGCALAGSGFSYVVDSTLARKIRYYPEPDDSLYQYYWDFGDGSGSTARMPVHTYAYGGNYMVNLVIVSNVQANPRDSCVAHIGQAISVGGPRDSCAVSFTYSASSATPPFQLSLDATPFPLSDSTTYTWVISTLYDSVYPIILNTRNPVATLQDSGTYRVSLQTFSPSGCNAFSTQVINIGGAQQAGTDPYPPVWLIPPPFMAFPNPVRDQANVDVLLDAVSPVNITIYNTMGRAVSQLQASAAPGLTTFTLQVRGMAPGIYFMVVRTVRGLHQSRFQKL